LSIFVVNDGVARLLRHQDGVATLAQLTGQGHTESSVRAEVTARRWQRIGSRCVVTHNHVPTRRQLMWVAVLDPVGPTALAGLTSLETVGFKFFGAEMEQIHVVVQRGSRYHRLPGVRIHESRRFDPDRVVHDADLPRLPTARSVLDAAAWQPHRRYAAALLAAGVQQRLCTAAELGDELPHVGRIRHKQMMRLTILDIGGGAEALSEIDIGSVCGRYQLVPPVRQRFRRDRQGRKRYLDCEWELPSGGIVVLEVDGAHHLLVEHWEADMKRERDIVVSGRRVLRATANEARYEQAGLARDLRAAGIPTELSGGGVAIAT
jgi:hypothetical protein